MTANLSKKKIALLTLLGLPLLLVSGAFAQESDQSTTSDKIGIEISSPTYSFELDPGETSTSQILKIRNVSDKEKTFYIEVLDFKASDEVGTPNFLTGNEETTYTHSLSSWVNISKEPISLKPGESDARSFTIVVPSDGEPGGHYAGILIGTNPAKSEGKNVVISNKVGSLLLVKVKGETNEVATVEEFSSKPKDFMENPPVAFIVRIKNSGSVHVAPKGIVEIKDIFGNKVATLPVNNDAAPGNVLPDSIRKFSGDKLSWKPSGFILGRYSANLLLNYGDPAKSLSATLNFWIVPWKVLLMIALGLIVLILLLVFLIKRYNRWVVAKAEKKEQGPKSEQPPLEAPKPSSETPAPPAGPPADGQGHEKN